MQPIRHKIPRPAPAGRRASDRGAVAAMQETEYSIQQVSEILGIPIQKLRRWDEQGVLVAGRSAGGHRRYSRELIDRLTGSVTGTGADKTNKELATIRKSLAEKRRIIQLLLESESRYRDLVETSHDLIWTTDSQGRFTYLNAAYNPVTDLSPLHGMPLQELYVSGTKISDLSPLAGMPLKSLFLAYCSNVTDISPLLEIPTLEHLMVPETARNVELLRKMPNLRHLDFTRAEQRGLLPRPDPTGGPRDLPTPPCDHDHRHRGPQRRPHGRHPKRRAV